MKPTAQSHAKPVTNATSGTGTLSATGKETFTVTFETIDMDIAPIHMVIEGRPPPSAPPTPTMKQEAAPTLPIRIYLQPSTATPSRSSRSHHDTSTPSASDEDDWFASGSGFLGDGRCEACGAVFASSRRQAFWKHIVLNKCRKRQALRGRSHLGQWWSGRKF